jgi:hypothetical protein
MNGRLRIDTELIDLVGTRFGRAGARRAGRGRNRFHRRGRGLELLRTLCDPDAIARAERRGANLQFVTDGSDTLVRPGHPVIGEVTPSVAVSHAPANSTRNWRNILSDFLRQQKDGVNGAQPDMRTNIQLAQFMMRSDVAPDLDVVVRASEGAITAANLVLEKKLARFCPGARSWLCRGSRPRRLPELARSRRGAEALLAAHEPHGADELMTVRWGGLRAANLFFGCGRG